MTKSVAPTPVNAGAGATYTIVVTNNGPSDAAGRDRHRPGRHRAHADRRRRRAVAPARSPPAPLSCAIGLLSPGLERHDHGAGAPSMPTFAGASIVNTATASSTTTRPDAGEQLGDGDVERDPQRRRLDRQDRPADDHRQRPGATYTLTIANAGPSQATGVTATDVLPTGLTFVSSPRAARRPGATVTCAGRHAGQRRVDHAHVRRQRRRRTCRRRWPTRPRSSATTPDPNTANNSSTFTSGGANVADVAVTKSIAPDHARRRQRDHLHDGRHQQRSVDGHRRVVDRHDPGRRDHHRCHLWPAARARSAPPSPARSAPWPRVRPGQWPSPAISISPTFSTGIILPLETT